MQNVGLALLVMLVGCTERRPAGKELGGVKKDDCLETYDADMAFVLLDRGGAERPGRGPGWTPRRAGSIRLA